MRRRLDKIEIQEPPIQELKKGRSCLTRSCFTGCGCLFFFIAASLVVLTFTSSPRPKELKVVPTHFPADVPVYDRDNIEKITFVSGKEKARGLEAVAFIPKVILSPLIIALNKGLTPRDLISGKEEIKISTESGWRQFITVIKKPVADHRDQVKIEWLDLPADPKFVYNYYQDELEKKKFSITELINTKETKQFSFQREKIEGALLITDDPDQPGTTAVTLTTNIPF
ncbi:MAG TPA: hypothetical protein VJB37_02095 [Patescibacteria group bacterium]|nr:hypothetical protein [Patescibacteria group bacterium]